MEFVDLHTHSIYSDGYNSPRDNVKMASENGVVVMAVTDHDNLGGITEALQAGEEFGIKVVPGIEITTSFHNQTIHVLGLGVPTDNTEFNNFLDKVFLDRKNGIISKMEKLNEVFLAEGKKTFDLNDFINSQGVFFNREKAARYLLSNDYFTNQEEAFQTLAKIKIQKAFSASSSDAINAIHAAGGVAILAHPFASSISLCKIDSTAEGQENLLKEMIAFGVDGIECHQSEYGPEQTAFALFLAKKYNLLTSVGSDWHGAVCDTDWDIKGLKNYYPDHIGGLNITASQVAPLLERLGIVVDKV